MDMHKLVGAVGLAALKIQRDEALIKHDEVVEAARALIAILDGNELHTCGSCAGRVLATLRCPIPGGSYFSCRKHGTKDATVLPIVEPLRRLRALTREDEDS